MSDVLQKKQKFDEAEKLARNALRIWQKSSGPDSEAADTARNTLAAALDGLGRRDEALREQRRVLASWSKRFGERSEKVGVGANNLAATELARISHTTFAQLNNIAEWLFRFSRASATVASGDAPVFRIFQG